MQTRLPERYDDPSFYLDEPNEAFRRLRHDDPVHWYEEGRFWVITKYDDIKLISSNPGHFSSVEIGIMSDLIAYRKGQEPPMVGSRGVMFTDPPEHAAIRKPVAVHFTPRNVTKLDDDVRGVVHDVVDRLPVGEVFDWIERVAEPIPVFVFAAILGLPTQDWDEVATWSTTIAALGGGSPGEDDLRIVFEEIYPYLADQLDRRRAQPTNDLLTMLLECETDGVPFDEAQALTWAIILLAAGSETTQSLLGGIAESFIANPDQARLVAEDPELAANAVEETLRWWTPVMSMARRATTDVPLRDVTINAKDGVLLAYASGNRDEDRWGDTADDYDVRRPDASGHLGFGFAEHFCLGAHLARREARITVEQLMARCSGIELAGERVPRRSALIHTDDRLDVRLVP